MEARGDGGSGGGIGFAGSSSSSSRFISQIFWPEHCLNLGGRRGYLIGWNTAAFKCLVVTLVTVDAETGLPTLAQTERALELLSADPRCRTLNDFCSSDGAPPTVLGEWLPNGPSRPQHGGGGGGTSGSGAGYDSYHDDGAGSAAAAAAARRQSANIWLTVGQSRGRPVLRSLYCCGCAYRTCCYVVLYRPCNPDVLEYLPTIRKSTSSGDEDGDGGGGGGGGGGDEDDKASFAAVDNNNNNNAHGENGSPLSRAADDAAEPLLSSAAPSAGASGARDEDVHGAAAGASGGGREVNAGVNRPSSGRTGASSSSSRSSSRQHTSTSLGDSTTTTAAAAAAAAAGGSSGTNGRGSGGLRRGRIGHGTALVSPSARETGNPSGLARDAASLLMGGGGGGGGEDPTDLDLAIRQVSCALTLERALRTILRDILLLEGKRSKGLAAAAAAAAAHELPYPGDGECSSPAFSVGVTAPGGAGQSPTPPARGPSSLGEGGGDGGGEEGVRGRAWRERGQGESPATDDDAASTAAGAPPATAAAAGDTTVAAGGQRGRRDSTMPVAGEGGDTVGSGRSVRRSVTFADEASPSSSSSSSSSSPDRSEEPFLEPSAPPSISRSCSRETEAAVSRAFATGGGTAEAAGRGGAPFATGKPPMHRNKKRVRDPGGTRKRRSGHDASQAAGPMEAGGAVAGSIGGVVVSIPGRILLDGCCLLLRVSSWVAFLVVAVLESKVVWTPLGDELWRSPSDASLVCAHLAARLRGALSLPLRLSRCWKERHQPAERRVEGLVGLSHWLFGVAADASLGIVACALLLRHTEAAARAAHQALHLLHVDVLSEELEWLNYFPAGFKLNVPLTHTLGSLTLVGMEAYASIVGQLAQWEGAAMKAIAICAAGAGLTTSLAVAHDILRLLALHTATAHTAFAALHNLHSSLLGSLWQLFRGRKRNVLRCRVDTCMYDACQLLLGTLVFTVLSFLTPTISVFYTFFCIVQAVAVGGQAVLACMFVLINELPVYRFLLLLTSPERLLSGFQLQVLDAALPPPSSSSAPATAAQRGGGGDSTGGLFNVGGGIDGNVGGGTAGGGKKADGGANSGVAAGAPGQWEGGANMVYFQLQRCRAPVSALLQPYAERARRAVRRYPPGALVKSLISGKPMPDVGFRDFVTVRPGGVLGRGGGDGGDGEWGGGGGVGGRADGLVRVCRSLWLEYCYGAS